MHKFVVHRPSWGRGATAAGALTATPEGMSKKRCCLGFLAVQLGAPESELNVDFPSYVPCLEYHEVVQSLLQSTRTEYSILATPYENVIARVNDAEEISDTEREAQLTALFAEVNITVEFTDEEEPCTSL